MQRGTALSASPHAGAVCEPLSSTSCTRPAPRAYICASTAGNSEAADGCARMPLCFASAGWTSTDAQRPAERRAGCHLHSCTATTSDTPDLSHPTSKSSSGRLHDGCGPCSQQAMASPNADGTAAAAVVEEGGQVAEVALQQRHKRGHRVKADQQLPPQPLGAPLAHHPCWAAGVILRRSSDHSFASWHSRMMQQDLHCCRSLDESIAAGPHALPSCSAAGAWCHLRRAEGVENPRWHIVTFAVGRGQLQGACAPAGMLDSTARASLGGAAPRSTSGSMLAAFRTAAATSGSRLWSACACMLPYLLSCDGMAPHAGVAQVHITVV